MGNETLQDTQSSHLGSDVTETDSFIIRLSISDKMCHRILKTTEQQLLYTISDF